MISLHFAIATLLTWAAQGQEINVRESQDLPATFNPPSEEINSLQEFVEDEYADLVIKFVNNKGLAKAKGLSKKGAQHVNARFKTAAVTVKGSDISSLLDDPDIESVEIDHVRYAFPSHPEGNIRGRNLAEESPWGLQGEFGVNLAGLPSPGEAKWKPRICVVDTGYGKGHPDLPNPAGGYNPYTSGRWDVDGYGHGSHCVSTFCI